MRPHPHVLCLLAPSLTIIMGSLLRRYIPHSLAIILFTIAGNAVNLVLPAIIARGIDALTTGDLQISGIITSFLAAAGAMVIFAYLQAIVQSIASERVAQDLRRALVDALSRQSYAYVERSTPAHLLTNLTSDVDAVKAFISQGVPTLISSVVLIMGTSAMLLWIKWQLACIVLLLVPLMGVVFAVSFGRMGGLFTKAQGVVDRINAVISESVLGAALIRVVYAGKVEGAKFDAVNTEAKNLGMQILKLFAWMFPIIGLISSLASLTILVVGGRMVMQSGMTLGEFAAFTTYLTIFIFPLVMMGFISHVMARAKASYGRIEALLATPAEETQGGVTATLRGDLSVESISMIYGEKKVLDDVSVTIPAGSKTAIIGPTAAGKSQLLAILIGLIAPTKGVVKYDGREVSEYNREDFYRQVGFVFQDSIVFNMSIRENIAFNTTVRDEDLARAIETAELADFVHTLPQGLDTIISERGTSLSGGQKQRVMLARALALSPRILLLDDFTARVDNATEARILANITKNYPDITLISVTQKVAHVAQYDRILLLMEGELLAQGTHAELMKASPEYVQIVHSQESTHKYEV